MHCADIMELDHETCLLDDDVIASCFMWSCDYCASCDVSFCCPEELAKAITQPKNEDPMPYITFSNLKNNHIISQSEPLEYVLE